MTSVLTHAIHDDAHLAVVIAETTELAQEAQTRHLAGRIPATAMAKALTGAALLASGLKDGEKQSLQMNFNGKLKSVFAEANADGQVRGFVRDHELPEMDDSMARWTAALGTEASLAVVRSRQGKLVYNGSIRVESPTITQDINQYLHESEQRYAAVELNAQYKGHGLTYVRGVFMQLLPGGDEADFARARKRFSDGVIFEGLAQRTPDEELLKLIWPGGAFRESGKKPITFHCPCSKERVRGMLASLGEMQLREIITEDRRAEVTCEFCSSNYILELAELESLLDDLLQSQQDQGPAGDSEK